MVVVRVGPGAAEFKLHRKLLCETSTFFNGILKWPCKETVDNVVYMPEDDEELFNAFVNWFYGYHESDHDPSKRDVTSRIMGELVDLFVFGDQIGAKRLQEYVVETFFKMMDTAHDYYLPHDVIDKIYRMDVSLVEPLRTMAVAFYIWVLSRDHLADPECAELWDTVPGFTRDCLVALGQIAADKDKPRSKGQSQFVKSPLRPGNKWHYLKMLHEKRKVVRKPRKTAIAKGLDPTTPGLPIPETGSDASQPQNGSVSGNSNAATNPGAPDAP